MDFHDFFRMFEIISVLSASFVISEFSGIFMFVKIFKMFADLSKNFWLATTENVAVTKKIY